MEIDRIAQKKFIGDKKEAICLCIFLHMTSESYL